jgi:hypothetical protein
MTDGTHPPARSEDFSAGHGSGIHIHACQYCKPLIPTIRTGPRRHDHDANNVPSRQLAVRQLHFFHFILQFFLLLSFSTGSRGV